MPSTPNSHSGIPMIVEGAEWKTFVLSEALLILCDHNSACGTCAGCKKMSKGYHPDFLQTSPAPKVEEIRSLLFELHKRPMEATKRVAVIPELSAQQIASQNALLKTLEEPSLKWALFLPVASRFQLLSTVRSRCLLTKLKSQATSPIDEEDSQLFDAIKNKDELSIFTLMEPSLSERAKAKKLFENLLLEASRQSYPAHWMKVAPALFEAPQLLQRNQHPKIVWDHVWSKSVAHEAD